MVKTFRESMGGLHIWTGLVFAWLLFFMFITGTLGYFDTEIDRWMKPELPASRVVSAVQSAEAAQRYLEQAHPQAETWFVQFPVNRATSTLRVHWQYPKNSGRSREERRGSAWLDLETGQQLSSRDTGGGQALYRMHYRLAYLPHTLAEWLVGIFSFFMLLALISGVIIHRNIFRDFFTFRPGKRQRSWLDLHNLSSVASLPFQLMITYSGLLFFLTTYMPLIVVGSYGFGGDKMNAFIDEIFPRERVEQRHEVKPMPSLKVLVADAENHWGAGKAGGLEVHWPGDAGAEVHIRGPKEGVTRNWAERVYDADGQRVVKAEPDRVPQMTFYSTMLGLHEGTFAGPILRWLYFSSGLLGAVMVASGLILWSVKRRARQLKQARPDRGFMLVERLNAGSLVGLPIGIAVYFGANRLLPLAMADRADWELHLLFISWLAVLLFASWRPIRRCWIELCGLAALSYLALPLLNGLTTSKHLLWSLSEQDWAMAAIDLTFLVSGLLFALAALQIRRYWKEPAAKRTASASPSVPSQEMAV